MRYSTSMAFLLLDLLYVFVVLGVKLVPDRMLDTAEAVRCPKALSLLSLSLSLYYKLLQILSSIYLTYTVKKGQLKLTFFGKITFFAVILSQKR